MDAVLLDEPIVVSGHLISKQVILSTPIGWLLGRDCPLLFGDCVEPVLGTGEPTDGPDGTQPIRRTMASPVSSPVASIRFQGNSIRSSMLFGPRARMLSLYPSTTGTSGRSHAGHGSSLATTTLSGTVWSDRLSLSSPSSDPGRVIILLAPQKISARGRRRRNDRFISRSWRRVTSARRTGFQAYYARPNGRRSCSRPSRNHC